ncbi:MAG: SurA N-terminal domain-containing protein [Rhodanobacteraceae bacterium]|nr:SurA N-terminal domain-containing protein [Rhodanobacteraceae bacterium]MBP9155464.1 SurA N-terminal domain-containing protein [Xanthomonadales bacterium]HQW80899.1 SurA N-terminal domain-containing protein [Pseudomonadota bacterium]
MLQSIREKSGSKIAYLILSLLMAAFMFFGIQGYFVASGDTGVAKVGKVEISSSDYRQRMNEQVQRMRTMMGDSFNSDFFSTPQYKRQVVDQIVDEELMTQAGAAAGVAVSDARLRDEIVKLDAFQIDGKFNPSQYSAVLQSNGLTVESFEQRMRRDLAVRELPSQVEATVMVTDTEVDAFVRLRDQTRSFRYATLTPAIVMADQVSDVDAKDYFQKHASKFTTKEQASLEYVELNAATLIVPPADEAALRDRYEQQKSSRYGSGDQRLVSHILVSVAPGADANAQKAALKKADELLAKIRGGASFESVAREASDDVGSKDSGGDLGWIEKTGAFEPSFEDALFGLAVGAVSDPVRTDQGYHLINVRESRAASFRPFEEVRAELESEYVTTEREHLFGEKFNDLVEEAFGSPGSLEPTAKALEAQVQKTELFDRDFGGGIAVYPKVREAAFSDPVLTERNNSEAIEIGENHVVVVRLLEHKPAAPRKFEDVIAEVKAMLASERQNKQDKDAADALFKRLLAGETLDALAAAAGVQVAVAEGVGRNGMTHDAKLVSEAFKLPRPAEGKTSPALVQESNQHYALIELTAVKDGDPKSLDEAARSAARDSLKSSFASSDNIALRDSLRKRVNIVIHEDRL